MTFADEPAVFLAVAADVLDRPVEEVLDLVDLDVLHSVFADAREAATSAGGFANPVRASLHRQAAALLTGLVLRRPLRRDNDAVAVATTLQFLASNGFSVDLGPAEAAAAVVARIAAGEHSLESVADWIARARVVYLSPGLWPEGTGITPPPVRRPRPKTGPSDRFTEQARRAIGAAQEEARRLGDVQVTPEHLLRGLLVSGDSAVVRVLTSLGVAPATVRRHLDNLSAPGGARRHGSGTPFTTETKAVLEFALREALLLGHDRIGAEHLLLAIVAQSAGDAARVLREFGLDRGQLTKEATWQSADILMPASTAAATPERRRAQLLGQVEEILDENDHLRAELRRLTDLLRRRGTEPGTAQAG